MPRSTIHTPSRRIAGLALVAAAVVAAACSSGPSSSTATTAGSTTTSVSIPPLTPAAPVGHTASGVPIYGPSWGHFGAAFGGAVSTMEAKQFLGSQCSNVTDAQLYIYGLTQEEIVHPQQTPSSNGPSQVVGVVEFPSASDASTCLATTTKSSSSTPTFTSVTVDGYPGKEYHLDASSVTTTTQPGAAPGAALSSGGFLFVAAGNRLYAVIARSDKYSEVHAFEQSFSVES